MPTPYVAFGNDNLERQPEVHAGDKFTCDKCGELHELRAGKSITLKADGTKEEKMDETLLFYYCGDKTYLGAVANRLIVYTKSDMHGEV